MPLKTVGMTCYADGGWPLRRYPPASRRRVRKYGVCLRDCWPELRSRAVGSWLAGVALACQELPWFPHFCFSRPELRSRANSTIFPAGATLACRWLQSAGMELRSLPDAPHLLLLMKPGLRSRANSTIGPTGATLACRWLQSTGMELRSLPDAPHIIIN